MLRKKKVIAEEKYPVEPIAPLTKEETIKLGKLIDSDEFRLLERYLTFLQQKNFEEFCNAKERLAEKPAGEKLIFLSGESSGILKVYTSFRLIWEKAQELIKESKE